MICKRELKGQVSTELLIIIGLVLVIFIPLLAMVYFKANEVNDQMGAYEAEFFVYRLAYLSNSIGSLGTNSTIYTDIYIPKNIIDLKTSSVGNGGEITMKVLTANGESEVSEIIKYPVKNPGTIIQGPSYGWARFRITSVYESGKGSVEITRE